MPPIPMVSAKKANRREKVSWNALRLVNAPNNIEVKGHERRQVQKQGGEKDVHSGGLSTASQKPRYELPKYPASHRPNLKALILGRSQRFFPHVRLCGGCSRSTEAV